MWNEQLRAKVSVNPRQEDKMDSARTGVHALAVPSIAVSSRVFYRDERRHPRCRLLLVLLAGLVAHLGPVSPAAAQTEIATTDSGPVQGVETPTIHKFLGIPYAAPPVGPLRWQPPQPHARWSTPIDATTFGAHCPQIATLFNFAGTPSTTEDCLFLNVYTPNHAGFARDVRRRRPVMVWIHGGGFMFGESDAYVPRKLVENGDVVVVTINYRLGALGFLAHPALTAESPDHVSGNYGLLDQQLALQWVQRNIAAFGGNPKRVTLFGESAGGRCVRAQLASPLAAGLFHRAIVGSAGMFLNPTLATAESQGMALATALGCGDQSAACLRGASVEQILANQGGASPVIDGVVLPQDLRTAFKNGLFNRVPVIEGSNHDETRLFVALQFDLVGGPVTAGGYEDAIASLFGIPGVGAVLASLPGWPYPLANYPSPDLALSALGTDAQWACNSRAASRYLSLYVPTYAYEFADENAPEIFLPPASFPYGADHASEIQYLFDLTPRVPAPPLDASQQELSKTMISYWTRFARSGRPQRTHSLTWPKYHASDAQGGAMLSLLTPAPQRGSGLSFSVDHQCSFWDPLLGN